MKGKKKIYAVIDTNVLVSSLFSPDGCSNPARVMNAIMSGVITPLYSNEIIEEYKDVLSRPKFKFDHLLVEKFISIFSDTGMPVVRTKVENEEFPDPDDIVFYEVAMSIEDSFLVTGNLKHFPVKPFVVTPAQMIEIITSQK